MQIQKSNGPVTSVGAAAGSSKFAIAMNGKAFRVLSDTMYQDKIGSIMRELACNALDAHIMAGTPEKPIHIHLPDSFEPWLIIRDEGVGLSPESINSVFCVYFESTKDQSNDAVGAFGLGAKTPFSYTDQFNVTSNYNGVCYMYSAFINADGIPEIQLMMEAETDQPNGVEIKIGVEKEDFRSFIDAAKVQLRFFPVKPIITNYGNGADFPFEEEEAALFQTDRIKVFKSTAYGRQPLHIVQGPVGYPLDVSLIDKHLSDKDRQFLATLKGIGANLYFNIGEIGVTASREGVEYKGITIDSLKSVIAGAHKDIIAWIETQMSSLPNVYEKVRFINANQTFKSIINGCNLDLEPAVKSNSGYMFRIGDCKAFYFNQSKTDAAGKPVTLKIRGVTITKYTSNGLNGFSGARNTSDDAILMPQPDGEVVVAIRDTNKTPVAKMREYFKTNGLKTMYTLSSNYDDIKFDDAFIAELKAHLGGFEAIKLVSEMPDPPRAAYDRSRADYTRPTAYAAHDVTDVDSVANWTRVYDKLGELTTADGDDVLKAVYLLVERQRTMGLDSDTKTLWKELSGAGVIDLPLFGIRSADADKLADSGIEWVSLQDYVKEKRDEIVSDPKLRRYSVAREVQDTIRGVIGNRFDALEGLNPKTSLARLLRVHKKAKDIIDKADGNSYMLRIAGYDADAHPVVKMAEKAATTVFDKTPMMTYAARNGYGTITGDEAKHIVQYINMCPTC